MFVKDLCIQSINGTVKFSNITQGTISNCKLASTSNRDDVYNVFLSNQSHYSRVVNCFIFGSIGIYNDSKLNTSNGLTIQNNYITYSKIGVYLNGTCHHLIANDLEGFTDLPYKLHCSSSILECIGERNNTGNWIKINGSSNNITVAMSSEGGSAYNPLLSIDGDCNKIDIINASGYKLFEYINGTGNTIKARNIVSIQNCPIMGKDEIIESKQKNLFVDDNIPLLFDIENDDIRNYITSGKYTYDETTKQITLTDSEILNINFSSLVGDEPYFIYYEGEGIPNKELFFPKIKIDGDSGQEDGIGGSLTFIKYPSTNIYNEFNYSDVSWKITKLKVAKYFTKKLIN